LTAPGLLSRRGRLLQGHGHDDHDAQRPFVWRAGPRRILEKLAGYYAGQKFVRVASELGSGYLNSNWGAGTNFLEITVSGSDGEGGEQTIVTARFDNLGKGASGSAVQNMNIMLGLPEETGLVEGEIS
jgi:N-acetyl-gamma-glutamyl-phosphate reductase